MAYQFALKTNLPTLILKPKIMDYTKLPQTVKGSNPLQSFMEWRQHSSESTTYYLYFLGLKTQIIGFMQRYNNRGMTLNTWSLNGEEVSFTLKPSQFAFIYEED